MGAEVVLNFDGCCEPNPGGVAAWGFVLVGPAGLDERRGGVCEAPLPTNNVAEWNALLEGLVELAGRPPRTPGWALLIRGDSQLVVRQLTGAWAAKKESLRAYRDHCRDVLDALGVEWRAEWVPREENAEADALAGAAWEAAAGREFPARPAWWKKHQQSKG